MDTTSTQTEAVEDQPKLRLELGKFYRGADGSQWATVVRYPNGIFDAVCVGVFCRETYQSNGFPVRDILTPPPILVAEWETPEGIDLYYAAYGSVFLTSDNELSFYYESNLVGAYRHMLADSNVFNTDRYGKRIGGDGCNLVERVFNPETDLPNEGEDIE